MLVLTQLSVGAFVVNLVFENLLGDATEPRLPQLHAVSALSFGLLALSASLLHLGRPRFAFRAVLGLRHSWLSREIVAFGLFALLALIYASVLLMTQQPSAAEQGMATVHADHITNWKSWLGWSVATSGAAGVFCSVMVYVFTGRECWSFTRVALRFSFTAAILGVAAAWLSILMVLLVLPSTGMLQMVREHGPRLCQTLMVLALAKLVCEAARFRHLFFARMTPLQRSALLQVRELSNVTLARFALGLLGGLVMPTMLLEKLPNLSGNNIASFAAITGLLFAANVAGELLERYLFFAACAAPRMPGGIR
jgi:DMSO reductase anchor subunit